MHYIGLQGCRAASPNYAPRFADINLFISIASFGLGASTLVFLYNMAKSWRWGEIAEGNPWRALTLEWQVSSPPPTFNFDRSRRSSATRTSTACRARSTRSSALPPRSRSERTDVHILVIANETVTSPTLLEAVRAEVHEIGDIVTVIAPVNEPRSGYVVYESTRRTSARRRLDKTLDYLRARASPPRASSSRRAPCRR
jgi:Heme/copper-type cytochrome/quinol oxidases, subunit 1